MIIGELRVYRLNGENWRWLVGLFIVFALGSYGETEVPGISTTGSAVDFRLVSLFKTPPMAGALPVRVTITNRTSSDRGWRFEAKSEAHDSQSVSIVTEFELPVPAGEVRSFDLNVPVPPLAGSHHSAPGIRFSASGPGIKAGSMAYLNATYGYGNTGTAFSVMTETIGQRLWSSLEVEAGKQVPPRQVRGSLVSLDHFPADWRGLSGVSQLWLATEDWGRLAADSRQAVLDWVYQGGALIVVGTQLPGAVAVDLQRLDAGSQAWACGAGSVKHMPVLVESLTEARVLKQMNRAGVAIGSVLRNSYSRGNWQVADDLPDPKPNVWLILIFMMLFAVIVGPVNLFVFTKGNRRSRLFITTPLISIAASCLLGILIIFQDGFGGRGERQLAVFLTPSQNRAQIFQQQISRTGLVFSGAFRSDEDVMAFPIRVGEGGKSSSGQSISLSFGADGAFGGDWFQSRSRQSQYFQTVRQTRGRLEILVGADGVPSIQSNLEVEVRNVYFRSEDGDQYTIPVLGAGERKKGTAVTDFVAKRKDLVKKRGPRFAALVAGATSGPQSFFCEAAAAGSDLMAPIDSYSGIRWTDDVIVFGSLTKPMGK